MDYETVKSRTCQLCHGTGVTGYAAEDDEYSLEPCDCQLPATDS